MITLTKGMPSLAIVPHNRGEVDVVLVNRSERVDHRKNGHAPRMLRVARTMREMLDKLDHFETSKSIRTH